MKHNASDCPYLHQSRLNSGVVRKGSAASLPRTTICFPLNSGRRASSMAAARFAPVLMPQAGPSMRMSRLASLIALFVSTINIVHDLTVKVCGHKAEPHSGYAVSAGASS